MLADDFHGISFLIFSKIEKNDAKIGVCCSRDWRFKGLITFMQINYVVLDPLII